MRPGGGSKLKNGGIPKVWEGTPIGCGNHEKRTESIEKKTKHVYVENCSVSRHQLASPSVSR
jgi:hypothetical protein